MSRTDSVSRREFARLCGCAAAGAAAAALGLALPGCDFTIINDAPTNPGGDLTVDVAAIAVGGGVVVQQKGPDGFRVVVVRVSEEQFRAFSTQCPHAAFPVEAPVDGRMRCLGHASHFDLQGVPLDGPAVGTGTLREWPSEYDPAQQRLLVRFA